VKVPGPGAYNSIAGINKEGRFNVSKFKSYGVAIINPAKSVPNIGRLSNWYNENIRPWTWTLRVEELDRIGC